MNAILENIRKTVNRTEDSDPSVSALPEGSRTYENYLNRAFEINNRAKEAFLALAPDSSGLPAAAKRWKRAAVSLERWAASFFNKAGGTEEEQKLALDIMASVTRESALRSDCMARYYKLLEEKDPAWRPELDEAEKSELEQLDVLNRMVNTQNAYISRHLTGGNIEDHEMQVEKEYSAQIKDTYRRIPEGHKFRPAYVYPPERVPEDEPVPQIPEAIDRYESIPFSEKVYDTDLDEFVSEDGLIDSKSMVFYPETKEVEFGFAGGPRQRWKYWKARDDRDVPEPDSWVLRYYRRWYREIYKKPDIKMPFM